MTAKVHPLSLGISIIYLLSKFYDVWWKIELALIFLSFNLLCASVYPQCNALKWYFHRILSNLVKYFNYCFAVRIFPPVVTQICLLPPWTPHHLSICDQLIYCCTKSQYKCSYHATPAPPPTTGRNPHVRFPLACCQPILHLSPLTHQ